MPGKLLRILAILAAFPQYRAFSPRRSICTSFLGSLEEKPFKLGRSGHTVCYFPVRFNLICWLSDKYSECYRVYIES